MARLIDGYNNEEEVVRDVELISRGASFRFLRNAVGG